ncbi:hypothetical protein EYF80_013069 [Liparis tanakae]|uniref:Uncharacterized protein n=1 Tax=Liparis tanakae TaxID=230148 RepID=A0A4Z2IFK9_9TELE|nr:hypothetical protein EYF80_013069 [Liparis tanakae]
MPSGGQDIRCFQSSVFTGKSVLTGRSPRRGIVGPRSVHPPSAVSLFMAPSLLVGKLLRSHSDAGMSRLT